MNRKQLMLVLAALVIVGSAGLVLLNQHHESWNAPGARMGDKVLPNFQPNEVAAIHIRGVSDLNLVHGSNLWQVSERDNYPASFGRISDLLIKLQGLKVVESETVAPAQLTRVNLDDPGNGGSSGTLVEFKDGQGKVIEALLLGKKHVREQGESSHSPLAAEPDGRYIRLRSHPQDVLLISDALGGLEPRPDMWVSKDFFKVEKVKSVSLTSTNDADSWKIFRETESSPWALVDAKSGEVLDTNKASQIANALSSPTFADVFPANVPAEAGSESPMTVAVETFDHFAYTLKIARAGDRCRMSVAVSADIPTESAAVAGGGEKGEQPRKLQEKLRQEKALAPWVYVINSWIIEPLIQDRAQILQGYQDKNAAAEAKAAAAAVQKAKPAWTPRVIQ